MNVNMNHETGMLKDRSSDFFSYKNNIDYMKYAFQNNVDFHLSKSSTISLHLNVQLNDMHGPLTTKDGNGVGDIFSAIMGTNLLISRLCFRKDRIHGTIGEVFLQVTINRSTR